MKINNANIGKNLTGIDNAKSKSLDKVSLSKGPDASKVDADLAGSSKVNLSERAQMMAKAKQIATEAADNVDEAKVARLQKLIDEGKYNVDAAAVADRLVDQHLIIPD